MDNTIACRLCGGLYKVISNTHLHSKHGITISAYRELFPDAPIDSPASKVLKDATRKVNANTAKGLEYRSKTGKANKGKKRSAEFKQRRSEEYTGSGNPFFDKTHSLETRKKLSAHFQGVSEGEWEGFSNSEHKRAWKSKRAKRWSQEILERDDFTCALCSKRGGDLEAHHIVPRAVSPELTYVLENGITLCVSCHRSTFGREVDYKDKFAGMVESKSHKVPKLLL